MNLLLRTNRAEFERWISFREEKDTNMHARSLERYHEHWPSLGREDRARSSCKVKLAETLGGLFHCDLVAIVHVKHVANLCPTPKCGSPPTSQDRQ